MGADETLVVLLLERDENIDNLLGLLTLALDLERLWKECSEKSLVDDVGGR